MYTLVDEIVYKVATDYDLEFLSRCEYWSLDRAFWLSQNEYDTIHGFINGEILLVAYALHIMHYYLQEQNKHMLRSEYQMGICFK